jgi:hypothetical protein
MEKSLAVPPNMGLKRKRLAGGEAQYSMSLLKQVDLILSIGTAHGGD